MPGPVAGAPSGDVAPPPTNRGVLNTLAADWLEFTAPDGATFAEVLAVFGPVEWTELQRGRCGYASARAFGHAEVWYAGKPGMGIHVKLTGQALAELETAGIVNRRALVAWALGMGYSISRFDVAVDDRSGSITDELVGSALDAGQVVTRWRSTDVIRRRQIGAPEVDGWTHYIGSFKSDAFCRIYDKAAEQRCTADGPWVRVEFQFRDERARLLAAVYAHEAERLPSVLAGYLRFVVPSGDSNRTRWPVAPWWDAVMGSPSPEALGHAREVRSLDRSELWIERQVSPALSAVVAGRRGDSAFLDRLLARGKARWSPELLALVRSAWAARGVVPSEAG